MLARARPHPRVVVGTGQVARAPLEHAGLLDLARDAIHFVGAAGGGHHCGTRLREPECERAADAGGAPDHDGGTVFETEFVVGHK